MTACEVGCDLPPSAAPVPRVSQDSSVGHWLGNGNTKIGIIQAAGQSLESGMIGKKWIVDEGLRSAVHFVAGREKG